MLLSLLIPTLKCREDFRQMLLDTLERQIGNRRHIVEIVLLEDDGEMSIGAKRNALVRMGRGKYFAMIDDDDMVAVNYVDSTMEALKKNPDCVGWRMKRFSNGQPIGEGIHSIKCGAYSQRELPQGMTMYLRTPNHLNPIRADLVRRCPYPEVNIAEDKAFAEAVFPLLKSEVFVDEYLYKYFYRTPYIRTHERTNVGVGKVA